MSDQMKTAQEMFDTAYELIDLIAEKYDIWSNISHIGNTDFGFKKSDFK